MTLRSLLSSICRASTIETHCNTVSYRPAWHYTRSNRTTQSCKLPSPLAIATPEPSQRDDHALTNSTRKLDMHRLAAHHAPPRKQTDPMSSKPDHRDMGSPRTCKGCTPIADTLTTDESVVSRTTPTKEPPQTHCSPTTLPPLTNCTYTLSPSYTVDCKTSLDNCSTNECYKLISLHTTDVPPPTKTM